MCWGINVPFIELLLAFNIRIYLVQYFFLFARYFSRLEKGIIIFFLYQLSLKHIIVFY